MHFELPKIVSEKTGNVLKKELLNAGAPNHYIRRTLIPGEDTFLSQKGVGGIVRDSDDKIVRVYDKAYNPVITGTPQEVKPFFQMLKKATGLRIGDI